MTGAREYTLGELAGALGAELGGDPETRIRSVAGLEDAAEGSLVRVEQPRYLSAALAGPAAALLVDDRTEVSGKPFLRVANVRVAFARCLELLYPERHPEPGIHPSAVVAEDAEITAGAAIGPGAVVGSRSRIAAGAVLHAHAVVGEDCEVGAGTILFPHVVLYPRTRVGARVRIHSGAVVGADGFGYVWDGKGHRKIPQVGGVHIGDDVEIGANTTIDGGTTSPTVIGPGTKIDNLAQIGHNVQIGPFNLIISQVGIGGSATTGTGVVLAGQAGLKDHVRIGDGSIVGGGSGVFGDVPPGVQVSGYPAREHRRDMRIQASLSRLPDLLKRVKELERRLGVDSGGSAGGEETAEPGKGS